MFENTWVNHLIFYFLENFLHSFVSLVLRSLMLKLKTLSLKMLSRQFISTCGTDDMISRSKAWNVNKCGLSLHVN